ncbi:MAG: GNAT family N-acetyltransferase [Pseudonocardiaceae bacterium]
MRSCDTRRRGVGDEALGQVSAWVRRHLASCIVLSVKSDNDHANRLYRRHGFVGGGPSPDDPDERLMRR